MAEGNGAVMNNFKEQLFLKTIDMVNDDLKIALLVGWTPSVDLNPVYSNVSAYEFADSSYATGGQSLGSKAVTQDDTANRGKFDAVDEIFEGLDGGTPGHAVLYDNTTASKWILCYWELGKAANGSDYKLQFHTDGIIYLA
jgi:hypothetical protein